MPLNLSAIKGTRNKSLWDYLNWAVPIDNGILLNKDGSFLAGWFYRGQDLHSSTNRLRSQISSQINDAMNQFGGGWTLYFEARKYETSSYPPPEASHFPDPVSRMVDDERREQFQAEGAHFETEYAVFAQYTPPARYKGRLAQMMFDVDSDERPQMGSILLDEFKRDLDSFEDILCNPVRMQRMTTERVEDEFGRSRHRDDLIDHLNCDLTGESGPVELVPGNYLEGFMGGQDVVFGPTCKIDGRFIAVVEIHGFPQLSHPNILDMIDCLPMPLRWSSRYIYMDQAEADKVIKQIEGKWKQKAHGWWMNLMQKEKRSPDDDALSQEMEARSARARTNSGTAATGYYTPVIVLMDEDAKVVVDRARIVRQALAKIGFKAETGTINTPEAWLGSLPGHPLYNVDQLPLHSDNLADMLPVAGVWTGSAACPCGPPYYDAGAPALLHAATTGARPYRLNLHYYDVGHTMIFGPTGAGKTTLLNMIILSALRYRGMRIWAFDYKRGMSVTVRACGGQHFDVAGLDGKLQFCPFSIIQNESDVLWGVGYISTLFELRTGRHPTVQQQDGIHTALMIIKDQPVRSMTHFVALVQDREVKEALQHYTLRGAMGRMLDAEEDNIEFGRLMAFEIEDLMKLSPAEIIPVLLYLFRQFERRLTDNSPTLLILDEAWLALGHSVMRAKIVEWLDVMRSKGVSVIMATQSMSAAVKSGILDKLIEAMPTKIALANEEALIAGTPEQPGPMVFYRSFGLSEVEINIIATATRKQHYYVFTPEGRRLISLGLGPKALRIAGATTRDDIRLTKGLERVYGAEWPMRWMEGKTVDDVALVA